MIIMTSNVGCIAAAGSCSGSGIRAFHARPRLSPCYAATKLLDLIHIVYAICRLGILGFDIEIKMSSERGGGESLSAKGTSAIFGCFGTIES
jgi:hypothetical protein